MRHLLWVLLLLTLLSGCAAQQPMDVQDPENAVWQHPQDPYESWNRRVFAFNDGLDRYLLKPAAQGYRAVTPKVVRQGIGNVFSNLGEVSNLVNNLLQAKPLDAGKDLLRFTLNTTVGLLGLFDVATPMGLTASEEDFGQTLSVWGVPQGPYLVMPILGGRVISDFASLPVEYYLQPVTYLDDWEIELAIAALWAMQARAGLLDAEELISGDRYSFMRDAYLQRRQYLIHDGQMDHDPFLDDDFDTLDLDDAFAE